VSFLLLVIFQKRKYINLIKQVNSIVFILIILFDTIIIIDFNLLIIKKELTMGFIIGIKLINRMSESAVHKCTEAAYNLAANLANKVKGLRARQEQPTVVIPGRALSLPSHSPLLLPASPSVEAVAQRVLPSLELPPPAQVASLPRNAGLNRLQDSINMRATIFEIEEQFKQLGQQGADREEMKALLKQLQSLQKEVMALQDPKLSEKYKLLKRTMQYEVSPLFQLDAMIDNEKALLRKSLYGLQNRFYNLHYVGITEAEKKALLKDLLLLGKKIRVKNDPKLTEQYQVLREEIQKHMVGVLSRLDLLIANKKSFN